VKTLSNRSSLEYKGRKDSQVARTSRPHWQNGGKQGEISSA
jgi:hypothetical protein